uniref:MRG domain-containing protein n=1 Tax=Glossina brevipalpis TaxID=37001 RepID=A0A1A9VZH0_9MUSC
MEKKMEIGSDEEMPNQTFGRNEKVLGCSEPLFYESMNLDYRIARKKLCNQWVEENHILQGMESNVQKQEQFLKQYRTPSAQDCKTVTIGTDDSSVKENGTNSSGIQSRASTPSRENSSSFESINPSQSSHGGAKKKYSEEKLDEVIAGFKFMTIDNNSDENNANRNKSSGVYANANGMNSNAMPYVQIESEVPLLPFPRMTPPVSLLNAATNLMPNANNDLHYDTENLDANWFFTETEIKIKMPEELKERLADDWEAINEQSKLLNIPSRITAQDVVD